MSDTIDNLVAPIFLASTSNRSARGPYGTFHIDRAVAATGPDGRLIDKASDISTDGSQVPGPSVLDLIDLNRAIVVGAVVHCGYGTDQSRGKKGCGAVCTTYFEQGRDIVGRCLSHAGLVGWAEGTGHAADIYPLIGLPRRKEAFTPGVNEPQAILSDLILKREVLLGEVEEIATPKRRFGDPLHAIGAGACLLAALLAAGMLGYSLNHSLLYLQVGLILLAAGLGGAVALGWTYLNPQVNDNL